LFGPVKYRNSNSKAGDVNSEFLDIKYGPCYLFCNPKNKAVIVEKQARGGGTLNR